MEIHEKIRSLREKKGISQRDAAQLAGITFQKWNELERGRVNQSRGMTVKMLRKIAHALGVKPGDLL